MLGQRRVRNAAEKAWGATKRATDGLILERTGREPSRTSQTSSGIKALARQVELLESLLIRFHARIRHLHSECFYDGDCKPEDYHIDLIRNTADFIREAERREAERLAG